VYEKGRLGVKKDKSTALGWYRKAAAQGDKDAADKAEDLAKDLAK
jgi:TPR repeat protein